MNILFVHQSFPAQFLNIAPYLASKVSGRVVFLTESSNDQNIHLNNVKYLYFKPHREPSKDIHPYLHPVEKSVLRGQAVVKMLDQLSNDGFRPDVVIAHGGSGYGLYIKELMPQVRLITYVEWFADRQNSSHLFADYSFNTQLSTMTGMWPFIHELSQSNDLVCPTYWQKSQFPEPFKSKITVIFDGVDLSLFRPQTCTGDLSLVSGTSGVSITIPSNDKLLTYGTRGMEPLRGFPEFMRAAAYAQARDPRLHVVIAGNDRVAYSYGPSETGQSWKSLLLEELKGSFNMDRLYFPGLLNYSELISLYSRSNLHCYFTRPYVISWSVFEAAACGSNLLINYFPGCEEVFDQTPASQIVDLDDQADLNDALVTALSASSNSQRMNGGVSFLKKGKDLVSCLKDWENFVLS